MRFILFIALFSLTAISIAQENNKEIAVRHFVKDDTVQLRWMPTNVDLFLKGLVNGYKIERITNSLPFENNASLVQYEIAPFEKRKNDFAKPGDSLITHMAIFIDEFIQQKNLSPEAKSMSFLMLALGSSTDKKLAQLLGVYFEDLVKNGEEFHYRISISSTQSKSEPVFVDTKNLSENQNFTTLNGSARKKLKQVYLNWEALTLQEGYAAYWVERSTDSIHFVRRNETPYLFLKSADEPNKTNIDFVDTAVRDGKTYYYRAVGINHFGEIGKSSNVVKVYVPKSLYGECRIDSVTAHETTRTLSGNFVDYRTENKIEKFVVLRADSILGPYQLMEETNYVSNNFQFTLNVPLSSGDRYYYKVVAVSPDNDSVSSFPYYFFTLDQIPPTVPVGLDGFINDSGVVFLHWKPNLENDIQGYRVYRSNSLKEEFLEVTRFFCTDSLFNDTLSLDNLTSTVFYKIAAVDDNFNNSKISAPVELTKPDTIAPVSALFSDYLISSDGVRLNWINSTSEDLSRNRLIRVYASQTDTILNWNDTSSSVIDTTCATGITYEYFILSFDKANNFSSSPFLRVNYETGVRPSVSNITSSIDRLERTIKLTWELPQEEIYSIQIYRAKSDEEMRLIKTIRDKECVEFIDKDLYINNTYSYKIKIVYKNGINSMLSEEIIVVY